MKVRIRWFVAFVLLWVVSPFATGDEDFREWTSTSGSTLVARLRSLNGSRVELITKDGNLLQLDSSQLSADDREYLKRIQTEGVGVLSRQAKKGSWYEFSLPPDCEFVCEYELQADGKFTITIPAEGSDSLVLGFDFEKKDDLARASQATREPVRVADADGRMESWASGRFGGEYPATEGKINLVIENHTVVGTKGVIWIEGGR